MTADRERSPVAALLGWLLIAVGGLIATTAGACSVFALAAALSGGDTFIDSLGTALPIILPVGGIPLAIGVGLVVLGRRMSARPKITTPD
ncbi:MAG: hypothetical protein ACI9YM_002273 [Brevundimonas sp.]|jgi:hypothetical protein|uniref:hypothetical protein n=1 Tax=Brevundimonas sp. TaxID=1871086 RepID=UPI0039E6744A